MNAIEIENLSKKFRSYESVFDVFTRKYKVVNALDNVSFTVKSGEIFGLLGPNGAGKTTLLNIISTLVLPESGSVRVYGIDVLKDPIKVRKIISLSSAFSQFGHHLTVRENLELSALHYDVDSNFENIIKLLELEDVINKQYNELSSGNKQKVVLAKSLIINPKLLIMDELTVALDPNISYKVRKILLNWQKKGHRTIMLATHNMYEAEALCKRLAVVHLGKIIAMDTPPKLKKMVNEEDTIEIKLIKSSSSISKIKKLEGVKRVTSYDSRIVVHVDDAENRMHKIIDLVSKRNKIISFKVHEPTLEDVFIKLTGEKLK